MTPKSKIRRGAVRREPIYGDPLSPSGRDPLADAPDCQAKRIITRFGGVQNLFRFLVKAGVRRTAMSIYHWVYSGGLIPPKGVRDVFLAEQTAGIHLTDADWSPYILIEEPEVPVPPPAPIEAPQEARASRRRVL